MSEDDRAERSVTRALTLALPAVAVIAALGTGFVMGPGTGILVLAGGGLVGVIMLVWTSLRTLGGDAPLEPELALAMASRRAKMDDLGERKRMALRSLKDLEHEHAIGKIDDADYADLAARLRDEAKAVMREMDHALDDRRARAEKIVATHLKKRGLADEPRGTVTENALPGNGVGGAGPESVDLVSSGGKVVRRACPSCAVSNEPDAAFCKKCGTAMQGATPAEATDA